MPKPNRKGFVHWLAAFQLALEEDARGARYTFCGRLILLTHVTADTGAVTCPHCLVPILRDVEKVLLHG